MKRQDGAGTDDGSWWDALWRWADEHSGLLGWMFVVSLASLVLCLLLLPVIIVRLPADHFSARRARAPRPRTWWNWLWHIVKNLLGAVFVVVGVVLLLLPGQGMLMILIGVLLMDFPGKQGLERRLIARPAILRVLNRMREKRGYAPLIVD